MRLTRFAILKLVVVLVLVVGVGVMAFSEEAVGTTFATGQGTGGLELKVDSTTYYNGVLQPALSWHLKNLVPGVDKFFKFRDVKPGDSGISTISLHVRKNPAWVCLDFLNLKDRENGRNEPEALEDGDNEGELSSELEFFAWHDDGDKTFEVGEEPLFGTSTQLAKDVLKGKSYAIADSQHGQPQYQYQTSYVGIAWCAGDLSVDLATAEIKCDPSPMGNEVQTDSMTLDVSLRAVSAYALPKYVCTGKSHGHGHGDDDDDNHHNNDYGWKWNKPDHSGGWKWDRLIAWFGFFNHFGRS